jgi:hypothetical protein
MQNKAVRDLRKFYQLLTKTLAERPIKRIKFGNDFQLSTNQKGSGNFDDIVYKSNTSLYAKRVFKGN